MGHTECCICGECGYWGRLVRKAGIMGILLVDRPQPGRWKAFSLLFVKDLSRRHDEFGQWTITMPEIS